MLKFWNFQVINILLSVPPKTSCRQVVYQQAREEVKEELGATAAPEATNGSLNRVLTDIREIKRFHIASFAAIENHNLTLSPYLRHTTIQLYPSRKVSIFLI